MPNKKNRKFSKRLPVYLLVPLLVLSFMVYLKKQREVGPPEISGIYLPKPEFVMPFVLTTAENENFTDENLLGKWSVLFFGFTYCPDVCPTTLATLDNVMTGLDEKYPSLIKPQVVFISIDPERDNLAQLNKYIKYFNQDFVGVTGSQKQLNSLSRQMGVVYDKVFLGNGEESDDYLMEHSTSLALINPKGGIQAILTAPHDVDTMVDDIAVVYRAYR